MSDASTDPTVPLRVRFRGALVGTMVGDALGMPLEGAPRTRIQRRHGEIRDMLDARLGRGTFTDDTQMTMALAEALLDGAGRLDADRTAARFAERYEPGRGYGGNTHRILSAIRAGEPWRNVVERYKLPGGSFANGAAMRVAPVALAFYGDEPAVLEAAAEQAAVTGHSHPVGRGAAMVQAAAVHDALRCGAEGEPLEAAPWLRRWGEETPAELGEALRWVADHLDADPSTVASVVGAGSAAEASVPAALWAFFSRHRSAEEAVVRAVGLGGDADTIGAMAGALAGAFHGVGAFPARWTETLEDGEDGRGRLVDLADRLCELRTRRRR